MDQKFKEFEEFRTSNERIAQELAKALNLPYFNLTFIKPDIKALEYLPEEIARQNKILPIKKELNVLYLGVINPYDENLKKIIDTLKKEKNIDVKIGIISENSFSIGIEEYKFLKTKKVTYIGTFEVNQDIVEEVIKNINNRKEIENKINEIINKDPFLIFDYLLAGAVKFKASDIHFEPYENFILVRYRIDGLLYDIFNFSKKIYPIIKNRIKILSGLKINIKDKPQDGRFTITINKENIDIRVSVVPAGDDEAIVLRILLLELIVKNIRDLGLREDDFEILNKSIYSPNGLILNTGPTGSGKTTTLYSIIMQIKKPELKILTIEDPIEYKIEGISQSQVEEEKGFTFSVALRAFLRHDPDVILVGEIRDKETAQIAVQAALTGHLVLSTLHTNDSLGAIPRLISLEVDPKLIPPALRLVIAQRLVRKICPYCSFEYIPDEDLKLKIQNKLKNLPQRVNLKDIDLNNFTLMKSKGCHYCFETGYKGMIAIFELLQINKQLESIIYKNPSELEIYEAVKDDFVSLQQDGLIKALKKITTIEEVERVTGLI
jgi:type II secretory ATPase GspE/PulE/Tfp pilus assembly ATPase PilB-like protein